MRLRAIDVKNWGCIESLVIPNLSDGVNLLTGPNRVGKSTLVQAIRSGLFDHFHDSQEATVLGAIPWHTRTTPSIIIEFEHAGQRYRLSKTFGKGRGGWTTLEQHGAVGWLVLERGKEAAKRVYTIVGADSSSAGVFQMLWLGQRDFTLPSPRDLDPSLAKTLESLLGTLITGRDLDFKDRLDAACQRWFTDLTMHVKRNSPLGRVEAELEDANEHLADINRMWNETEDALTQYEAGIASQPDLTRNLDEAEKELARIGAERQGIVVRKSQNEFAVRHRDAEQRHRLQAEQQLQAWDQTEARRAKVEKELLAANLHLTSADERVRFAQSAVDQARSAVDEAQSQFAQHQRTRAAIDDRLHLAHLTTQGQGIDRTIEQVQDWLKTLAELQAKPNAAPILSATEIERLRRLRDEAIQVRAQLEASEIHVVVQAKKPIEGTIAVDGQPASEMLLFASAEQEWRVHRQADVTIDKIATVRIRRNTDERNVNQMKQRLADLERDYAAALETAHIDPAQADALDVLTLRRLEDEAWKKEERRLREAETRSAPEGLPALETQRAALRRQTDAILARRPELRGAVVDQQAIDRLRCDYDEREQHLAGNLDAARKRLAAAEHTLGAESAARQSVRDLAAKLTVELQAATDSLAQRDRAALALAVEEGKSRLAEAEAKVVETTLSDAEQAIETRYQVAQAARNHHDQCVRAADLVLEGLRVKLAGTEGLHQIRIQAEQRVNDLTRELDRERLYADAHKHLKEAFEEVRSEQVGRTVGPINDRVMAWVHELGLSDYRGLSFGEQLLPSGLFSAHLSNGDPVALDCESYGTVEQLTLLIRLAVGGLFAQREPAVAILDDPLAHADPGKHRKMLEILTAASKGSLQLIILTCHEERFAELEAQRFDLTHLIRRVGAGVR